MTEDAGLTPEEELELYALIDRAAAELKEACGDSWEAVRLSLAIDFERMPPTPEEMREVLRRLRTGEPMLCDESEGEGGED